LRSRSLTGLRAMQRLLHSSRGFATRICYATNRGQESIQLKLELSLLISTMAVCRRLMLYWRLLCLIRKLIELVPSLTRVIRPSVSPLLDPDNRFESHQLSGVKCRGRFLVRLTNFTSQIQILASCTRVAKNLINLGAEMGATPIDEAGSRGLASKAALFWTEVQAVESPAAAWAA
jgi:hypothetical protein